MNAQAIIRRSPLSAAAARCGRWGVVLRRAFWSAGVLAHVPAVVRLAAADWSGFEHVIRAGMLVVGLAFCLLKVLDWSALRVRPGWRSGVICAVALALLHIGCLPGVDEASTELCLVTTTGASAAAVLAWHVCEHKPLSTEARSCQAHRRTLHPFDRWDEHGFCPALILIGPLFAAPRAPPVV